MATATSKSRVPPTPIRATCPLMVMAALVFIALSLTLGCSGGPPALTPPDLDPEAAAEKALEMYDSDGDGSLSLAELEACPGMKKMIKIYDADGNESISLAEIRERLQRYADSRAALLPLSAKVRFDNRPLKGATIRFVPESYLNDAVKAASGTTAVSGSARMAIAPEDLPENQRKIRGIQVGTYRVEITHPEIDIPAEFNTETTLGYEPIFGQPNVEFRITSKGKNP